MYFLETLDISRILNIPADFSGKIDVIKRDDNIKLEYCFEDGKLVEMAAKSHES